MEIKTRDDAIRAVDQITSGACNMLPIIRALLQVAEIERDHEPIQNSALVACLLDHLVQLSKVDAQDAFRQLFDMADALRIREAA